MTKKSLLSIAPKSEFSGAVIVPTPDRAPDEVEFTFKYRDREALDAWIKEMETTTRDATSLEADIAMVMGCATGWELEDAFNAENVRKLLLDHSGAAANVFQVYVGLSRLGREKN